MSLPHGTRSTAATSGIPAASSSQSASTTGALFSRRGLLLINVVLVAMVVALLALLTTNGVGTHRTKPDSLIPIVTSAGPAAYPTSAIESSTHAHRHASSDGAASAAQGALQRRLHNKIGAQNPEEHAPHTHVAADNLLDHTWDQSSKHEAQQPTLPAAIKPDHTAAADPIPATSDPVPIRDPTADPTPTVTPTPTADPAPPPSPVATAVAAPAIHTALASDASSAPAVPTSVAPTPTIAPPSAVQPASPLASVPKITPFRFARPASPSSLFITSTPNSGAGVGHQLGQTHIRGASTHFRAGEWIFGPLLAARYNLTYLHSNFYRNAARWNSFLGFGEGEQTPEDLLQAYGDDAPAIATTAIATDASSAAPLLLAVGVQRHGRVTIAKRGDLERDKQGKLDDWLFATLEQHRADSMARPSTSVERISPLAHGASAAASSFSLDPSMPDPLLLRIDQQHIPLPPHLFFCAHPSVYQTLRQKYCYARVTQPADWTDLYESDRAENAIVVALHLRCGDSCFNRYRATSFESLTHTAQRLHAVLSTLTMDTSAAGGSVASAGSGPVAPLRRPIRFHLFTQPPPNVTVESHFEPLLSDLRVSGLSVTTHFDTGSESTLHHLIRSDVLLGAQSSFSWLAFLLHYGVSLGPVRNCVHSVDYNKKTGEFDEEQLRREFVAAAPNLPRFDSYQDCLNIRPHDQ